MRKGFSYYVCQNGFIFTALILVCCVSAIDFSYDSSHTYGPRNWEDVDLDDDNKWDDYFGGRKNMDIDFTDNMCGVDNEWPSPINLVAGDNPCEDTHEMLTPRIRYINCEMEDLTFTIEPHSLRAYVPDRDSEECLRTWIDISNGFPNKFYLWFVEVKLRGEHVFDGRRFDGEVIFAHGEYPHDNTQLSFVSFPLDASSVRDDPMMQDWIDQWQAASDSIDETCDEEGKLRKKDRFYKPPKMHSKDARFYEELEATKVHDHHWEHVVRSLYTEDADGNLKRKKRRLEDDEEGFVTKPKPFPYDLWPTIWYYRYRGSMTEPPCYNNVHWRVFDEPRKISRKQFKQLAKLTNSYRNKNCEPAAITTVRGDSFRPLQKSNEVQETELVHCTIEDFEGHLYDPEDLIWEPS